MKANGARTLLLILLLLLSLNIWSCDGRKDEVNVGVISELTGPIASFGKRASNGIQLAADVINEGGGINGRKVRLIVEDDRSNPQGAATSMKKLVEVDRVPVVVGMVGSSMGMSAAPIANENRAVLIACGVSTPAYSTPDDYTFRIRGSARFEVGAMASLAYREYGVRKIGILHVQNDYGISYKDVFEQEFKSLSGDVAAVEAYPSGASDLRTQLTKINSAKVEAVYLIGQGPENGYALRQAKELGIKARFFATVGMEVPEALKIAGDAAEDVIYTTTGFDPNSADPLVHDFNDRYKRKYGEESDLFAAEGYDALRIAALALSKVPNKADDIRQFLYGLKDYEGVTGRITFDKNGDPEKKKIFLKTIKNQKYVILNNNVTL